MSVCMCGIVGVGSGDPGDYGKRLILSLPRSVKKVWFLMLSHIESLAVFV